MNITKSEKAKYPIKAVSQVTGLSIHVIRAWEKRYNAVVPVRTETNRRLYSDKDIEKLKILAKLTDSGYNISGIANLKHSELIDLIPDQKEVLKKNNSAVTVTQDSNATNNLLDACLKSILDVKVKELENNLFKASVNLSQPVLLEKIVIPLIFKVGEMWKNGDLRIYQEHLVTVTLRNFLAGLVDSSLNNDSAPKIIVTTPQGQIHELGALIVAATASTEGWNVTYLGPSLPAEEIVGAAKQLECRAIALSIVFPMDDWILSKELMKFKKILPAEISLLVGGKGVEGYVDVLTNIGAEIVNDLSVFRKKLSSLVI